MMIFTGTFYIAALICLLGIFWRTGLWFMNGLGPEALHFSHGKRLASAVGSMIRVVFSFRILKIMRGLIRDIVFQLPLLKAGFARWLAHMCIFYGFLFLLIFHALGDQLILPFYPDYASTLNPFFFLRNFFGALVIFGILMAVANRMQRSKKFHATHGTDVAAFIIIGVILGSGFLLEAVQIISAPMFDQMVEDYMGSDDPGEIEQLKTFWADQFNVVFPGTLSSLDADLNAGQDLHEAYCAACHSSPRAAFVSYPVSRMLRSPAPWLNYHRADIWLWYVHFLACFAGLAMLPFSKFFHLISIPINWMVSAAAEVKGAHRTASEGVEPGPNTATRYILGLDACTHCGICSVNCSVEPMYRVIGNTAILPSEKLGFIKKMAEHPLQDNDFLNTLARGSFICTECHRCTAVCPSGIILADLWKTKKKALEEKGYGNVHSRMLAPMVDKVSHNPAFIELRGKTLIGKGPGMEKDLADCIQCSICSNVCPVVTTGTDIPLQSQTPQQVLNLLRMGLMDLAARSDMVWNCTTCYKCQEYCPQNIRITDIFYELRNRVTSTLYEEIPKSSQSAAHRKGGDVS
ncbi:MAG: 4Fe-4S dicluster domain-containing protein [Proteobacteria bacterium]|nr:4Fe-4S dicluster domain-containing protein [Pseudomonadota bacterium]